MPLTPNDERDVIPCEADPDYECVRIGSQTTDGGMATPPPGVAETPDARRLCPDGYVPRRRRRPYDVQGKRVVRNAPPERNPGA